MVCEVIWRAIQWDITFAYSRTMYNISTVEADLLDSNIVHFHTNIVPLCDYNGNVSLTTEVLISTKLIQVWHLLQVNSASHQCRQFCLLSVLISPSCYAAGQIYLFQSKNKEKKRHFWGMNLLLWNLINVRNNWKMTYLRLSIGPGSTKWGNRR